MVAWRFYVYEVLDALGAVIYVGKGSGSRKNTSRRQRGGGSVREVARFRREAHAYAFEIERIAETQPGLNRHPGGNGSRAVPKRQPRPVGAALYDLIAQIGTRAVAARLALLHAPRLGIPLPKVDELRRVAYG